METRRDEPSTPRPLLPRHLQRCADLVRMLFSGPGIQPAPPLRRKLIGHSTSCDHPSDAD